RHVGRGSAGGTGRPHRHLRGRPVLALRPFLGPPVLPRGGGLVQLAAQAPGPVVDASGLAGRGTSACGRVRGTGSGGRAPPLTRQPLRAARRPRRAGRAAPGRAPLDWRTRGVPAGASRRAAAARPQAATSSSGSGRPSASAWSTLRRILPV